MHQTPFRMMQSRLPKASSSVLVCQPQPRPASLRQMFSKLVSHHRARSSEDATSAASSTPATLVVETPTKLTGLVEPASASASGLEDSLPAPSLPEATSDGADDQAQVEQPLREVTSDSAEVEQEAAASMHPGAGDGAQGDGDDISTRMPMQIALELPASGAGDTAGNFSVLDYMVACLHEGAVVMSGVFL